MDKSTRVLEKLNPFILCFKLPRMLLFNICTFDLFHEARVFCKKVLIESEKRLDFIGALICNIKVRLNSATNFVIH